MPRESTRATQRQTPITTWGTTRRGSRSRFRTTSWVEVEVPHDLYNADWNTSDPSLSPSQLRRAEHYASMPGPLPPGMARFTGRSAKRGVPKLYISDGNHRAYASFLRGSPTARFYMPRKEWKAFQDAVNRG
jgi:hypothetical protein